MAKVPAQQSSSLSLSSIALGPKLMGFGIALLLATRVVKWLPLGLLGSWINGILYPIILLSVLVGGGLILLKSKRS